MGQPNVPRGRGGLSLQFPYKARKHDLTRGKLKDTSSFTGPPPEGSQSYRNVYPAQPGEGCRQPFWAYLACEEERIENSLVVQIER